MNSRISLLICDDDQLFHTAIKHTLSKEFQCKSAYDCDEALTVLKTKQFEIMLLDVQMRTPTEGLDSLEKFSEIDPEMKIIMISGRDDFEAVREALTSGASDYIVKDAEPESLAHVVKRNLENRRNEQQKRQHAFEVRLVQKKHVLVGESQVMAKLQSSIEKIKKSRANVVIFGETGTGKEVVARQLRTEMSDGTLAPFVAVDSSTIQSSTAESLLFGHEKGAFTGAEIAKRGIFEEADGGIVYFDEIANMPLEIQVKLLRVIEEGEITRLGSHRVIPLQFRVICATNRNLEKMAKEGQFKDDLLQRLNVLPIELPPLRERKEDIPLLIEYFCGQGGCSFEFTSDAMKLIQNYPWPGNVRELKNLISYLEVMLDSPKVKPEDLSPKLRKVETPFEKQGGHGFYEQVEAFEKDLLKREFESHGGNVSKMARSLEMDRSYLHTKLKNFGINQKKAGE